MFTRKNIKILNIPIFFKDVTSYVPELGCGVFLLVAIIERRCKKIQLIVVALFGYSCLLCVNVTYLFYV